MINVTVPDGTIGRWSVNTFTVSEQESEFTRIRAIRHPEEYVPPGTYKRLLRGPEVIMSNTPMEESTNGPIIHRAHGVVLINGLGLGMVLTAILAKPRVDAIEVNEISEEVIALVGPHFKDPRVTIRQVDAFEYKPDKGKRYNAVWHDIWDCMCADNLKEMSILKRKYGRYSDWQGCWSEDMCRRYSRVYGY